jgi:hypothetical protein
VQKAVKRGARGNRVDRVGERERGITWLRERDITWLKEWKEVHIRVREFDIT